MVDLIAARKRVAQKCTAIVMETHPGRNGSYRDDTATGLRERFEAPSGPLAPLCVAYDQVVREVEQERDAALKKLSELTTKRDLWMCALREVRVAQRALERAQAHPIASIGKIVAIEAKAKLEKAQATLKDRENALLGDGVLRE